MKNPRINLNYASHTSQIDKQKDLLLDPPSTLALRKVRRTKLPSGKCVTLESAPPSIFAREQYNQTIKTTRGLASDPNVIVVDGDTGKPVDFVTRFPHTVNKLPVSTRKIPPLRPEERSGPLFRS